MEKNRVSKGIYYYIPERYEDSVEFQITFRALSYKELDALTNLLRQNRHNLFAYQVCKTAILEVIDELGNTHPLDKLNPDVIMETSEKILEMSSLPEDELQTLQTTITIAFDDTFKGDSWKCDVCQYKKLDRVRNCGIRGEKEKSKDFSVMVGRQVYRHCPIYDLDPQLLDSAIESYSMYDKNIMPDEGGLHDQTRFFVVSSQLVTQKLREEELKEMKKQQKKAK